ncbi:CWC16 protein [Baffinella frigidus]|nr:CWC16 protein [Cryptophyta sp. CCMP2293]
MATRKETNRYHPPEFWDAKGFNDKANLNSFRGESWRNRGAQSSGAAQVNSKLLTQGRNVIRFEMPWDIICSGEKCGECIHKGVRFNADKEKAGKYFTTQIWHFEMKCHLCDNKITIATDPENCEYKCISGCRRKQETWAEDDDTLKRPDAREKRKLEEDPFYRLEHFAADDGTGRRQAAARC